MHRVIYVKRCNSSNRLLLLVNVPTLLYKNEMLNKEKQSSSSSLYHRQQLHKLQGRIRTGMDQQFVWPWCGVIANLPIEKDEVTGLPVGTSTSGLRNRLRDEGFSPTKVKAVWNYEGFSGFALVDFTSDRSGHENAMNFERSFEEQNLGKRDYANGIDSSDNRLYGWVARAEDYHSSSAVGKELKKRRSLKSFSEFLAEEERKAERLARAWANFERGRKHDEDNEPGNHQRGEL